MGYHRYKGGVVRYFIACMCVITGLFAQNYHGCTLAPDNIHGWVVRLDTALIYHTTNGGTTWWYTQTIPTGSKRFFDVECIDEKRVWTVGILGEILHTENGGLDWYRQVTGLSKYGTRLTFVDSNYAWTAMGDGTVGKTIDGGGRYVNELHVGYRTKTGGSWNAPVELKLYQRSIDVSFADSVPFDTTANQADSIRVYYYYTDLGTKAFYTGIDNVSIVAHSDRGAGIERQSWDFESGWQGWSHTSGQTFPAAWGVRASGIHTPPPNAGDSTLWIDSDAAGLGAVINDTAWSPAFAPVTDATQWLTWSVSIYGEGTFWEQVFTPYVHAEFYGVSFVNQNDGWIVAGYPDSMLTDQGLILRSTDGGIMWDSLYQAPGYEDIFDVHFFNLLVGVVVGGDESDTSAIIMRTTDGGNSWINVSAPANTYYLRALEFFGNEGWAVGRFGSIIHTTDAGVSWSSQTSTATNTLFDVDFSDEDHGLICGYDIILRTTNGGNTWLETGVEEFHDPDMQSRVLTVYPNPFRENTRVTFTMSSGASVSDISIYDALGRLVYTSNPSLYAPYSSLIWDGRDLGGMSVPEGVYFLQIKTNSGNETVKIIRIR